MDLTFFYVCLSYHTFFFLSFEVVIVARKGNGISFLWQTQIHELPYVTLRAYVVGILYT